MGTIRMHEASAKRLLPSTQAQKWDFEFLGGQSGGVCDFIHASQKGKTRKYMGRRVQDEA
jgi:hypothetical protein